MSGVTSAVDFFDMVGQTDWNRSMQRTLIHWMGLNESAHVLDAGCRSGRFTVSMAGRVAWVTAVDNSEQMVDRARNIAGDYSITNTTFVTGKMEDLPFPDDHFDVVTSTNTVLSAEQWGPVIEEMIRVLRPTGQLIALFPSDTLNPWTAQQYCVHNGLSDFEGQSFLSWALACARQKTLTIDALQGMVQDTGGTILENTFILDNLGWVVRIGKPSIA